METLKKEDFEKNTSASYLDLSGIKKGSHIHQLIEYLNVNFSDSQKKPDKTIMMHGGICEQHDDYCLCECRL